MLNIAVTALVDHGDDIECVTVFCDEGLPSRDDDAWDSLQEVADAWEERGVAIDFGGDDTVELELPDAFLPGERADAVALVNKIRDDIDAALLGERAE
jgi:hypothetical protein